VGQRQSGVALAQDRDRGGGRAFGREQAVEVLIRARRHAAEGDCERGAEQHGNYRCNDDQHRIHPMTLGWIGSLCGPSHIARTSFQSHAHGNPL
jgi:hypothetical protein